MCMLLCWLSISVHVIFSMSYLDSQTFGMYNHICGIKYDFHLDNFRFVRLYGYYIFSHFNCQVFAFLRYIIAFADFTTLSFISLNLSINTLLPNLCKKVNKRTLAIIQIVFAWFYSIAISCIPFLTGCGQYGFDPVQGRCNLILAFPTVAPEFYITHWYENSMLVK